MKREIIDEKDIDAFASDSADSSDGPSNSSTGPEPFVWIGGGELTKMEAKRKPMVVDKILPAGALTLNASKSKSGKTTLMIEICHAVATGRPVLGRFPVTQGPVLYWLADDANVPRFAEAWRIVGGDEQVENFHLCLMRQHLYPDGLINLRKAVEEFKPVLMVVDSYTTIRTPRGRNTDFVKAEYDDMRRLSELAAETGAAINLIHHQSKAKQADPFDAAAGSYAMSAGSDGRMAVEKLDGTERLVRVDGRDLDAFQFVYARGADRRLFHVIEGPAANHWERIRIMAARQHGTSFTTKDAGETFGLGDRQARRILAQWESIGALTETERGRFILENKIIEAVARAQKATER
jgi:RecA-family ATPase